MAIFSDKFDRPDFNFSSLIETDWDVHNNFDKLGVAFGTGQVASNQVANQPVLLAQVGTQMTTGVQRVKAEFRVIADTDPDNSQIAIGYGFYALPPDLEDPGPNVGIDPDDNDFGIGVMFDLSTNTLFIFGNPQNNRGNELTSATYQDASLVSISLDGLLREKNASIYGVWQSLEFTGQVVSGGLLLRAYLNGAPPNKPTIQAQFQRDPFDDANYYQGFFYFGPTSLAPLLQLTDFFQEDFSAPAPQLLEAAPRELPTLKEARDAVRLIYERSTASKDLEDDLIRLQLNFTQRDMAKFCGHFAYYLRIEEPIAFEIDGKGYAVMPEKIQRVLTITLDETSRSSVSFTQVSKTGGGRCQVYFPARPSGNLRIVYLRAITDAVIDDDSMFVPRDFLECLAIGAAYRVARSGSDRMLRSELQGEYERLKRELKRDGARDFGQRNMRMVAGRTRDGRVQFESARDDRGY